MEVALPRGPAQEAQFATVTKRLKDQDGLPCGVANPNPLLDTQLYEVTFLDGHTEELSANTIAQNLFAQVDKEGHHHLLMDSIMEHQK